MNLIKRSIMAGIMTISLWGGQEVRATSFILGDYVYVVNETTGLAVTGSVKELQFGFFASGFTPTAANASQWLANFTGVTGYYDPSGPEWSAGISTGNNTTYAINQQLSAIVFNLDDDTDLLTALAGGLSGSVQAAIVTNPLWTVVAASGSDPTSYVFDLNGRTVDTGSSQTFTAGASVALVGSINSETSTVALVPEPSTGALMMIGAAGLVALRRLRKV